ncbi:MAG: LON peptidase substrate-binding domain-containing protein [Actinomycetota bacterium]
MADDEIRELAMFPLGTVLFPHAVLPLHVFEPRYRALVTDCLAGDGSFGVVLIERGHEVGGGDARFGIGTMTRIVQADEMPDGRWGVVAVGAERIVVHEWLAEDPYPRAIVTIRPDLAPPRAATPAVDAARAALVRVHALRAELGLPAYTGDVLLPDDVGRASYEAAILAPIGPLDAYALLVVDDPVERLERLVDLLSGEIELLEFRRSG